MWSSIKTLLKKYTKISTKTTKSLIYSKAKNANKRKLNDLQSEMEDLAKKLKKTEDSIVTESVSLFKTIS